MTNTNTKIDNEKMVSIRKGMFMCLEDAVAKADAGDKQPLKDVLNKIGNDYKEYGYRITKVMNNIYIRGTKYTAKDNVLVVLENGMQMFTIFKDKQTGKGWVDVDQLDLLTESEQRELFKKRVEGK